MVSLSSYDFFVILSSCHLVILSSCHLVISLPCTIRIHRVHFRLVIYIVVTLDVYIYVPVTQRITFVKSTRSTPQDATVWEYECMKYRSVSVWEYECMKYSSVSVWEYECT